MFISTVLSVMIFCYADYVWMLIDEQVSVYLCVDGNIVNTVFQQSYICCLALPVHCAH